MLENFRPRRSRRRQAAFSVLELTLSMTILALIFGLLTQFMMTAAHVAQYQQAGLTLQYQSQFNLDVLTQDIQGADLCLAQYTNGSTTYASNGSTTLVLRTPSTNTTGTAPSTTEDHIIYQIVATTAGAATGPYTLNRTVVPASGSGRAAVTNQIVETNITSASFTYIGAQMQTQSALGTLTVFTLANGAAYTVPSGATDVHQVVTQGTDLCPSSTCYLLSIVTTPSAPAANATVDFRFTVNPASTVSSAILSSVGVTLASGETANFAKQIQITLQMQAAAGNGNTVSTASPSQTLTTTGALRNKAAF